METQWHVVKREFKWQSHGVVHLHLDYLVGVRYPVLGDGPYCGPNPAHVEWTPDIQGASMWDTQWGADMAARMTRDTMATTSTLVSETSRGAT